MAAAPARLIVINACHFDLPVYEHSVAASASALRQTRWHFAGKRLETSRPPADKADCKRVPAAALLSYNSRFHAVYAGCSVSI